jgi:hypothetical protein
MSSLDAGLVALAYTRGVAVRRGNFSHRQLNADPITLVLWQPGGEPHTLAACGYGRSRADLTVQSCPRPLNRTAMFKVLGELAHWFNIQFEMPWEHRVQLTTPTGKDYERPVELPQLLLPNPGTVTFARKLGRRLAYLPTVATPDGPPPADPSLVRFGRHLQFLTDHSRVPGQQLIVDAVSLLETNWITAQTIAERANLAAFAAWVCPRPGLDGYASALIDERTKVGPAPDPDDERLLARDMDDYATAMAGQPDNSAPIGKAAAAAASRILDQYRSLTQVAWDLTWDVRDHEATWPVEPRYTPGRVELDKEAYSRHMEWMNGPAEGRRRTRQSTRQTIPARRRAEGAASRTRAEMACSDAPRLIPYLLDHKAISGTIVSYEDIKEVKPGNVRRTSVPRITLRTDWPSLMPIGKELWWTEEPGKVQVAVEQVTADPAGAAGSSSGSLVRLKVTEGARAAIGLNVVGSSASFSALTTQTFDFAMLPPDDPFTHRRAGSTGPDHLEDGTSADVGTPVPAETSQDVAQ